MADDSLQAGTGAASGPLDVPCVGAVIHDESGRLLLVRRGHEPGAGQWSVPGGRIEPGETATEAVAREVQEETGLTVRVGRHLGRVHRAGPHHTRFVIDDYVCAVPAASGRPASAAPLAPGDDATAAAWFSRTQLARADLVTGLWEALRGWGVLPPAE